MSISLFQILFILFSLGAVLRVVLRKKSGDVSSKTAAVWIVFWTFTAGAVLVPDSLTFLANVVGIGRGADLVTYVSLAALFFILFRLHLRLERQEREITVLIRKDAIKNIAKK